jgi:flagellar motor component MotA
MNNQPQPEIATQSEVLEMLTEKAREGSTSAMIALERALRLDPEPNFVDDELDRVLDGDK